MKVVIAGTYSQAGLAALADATYEQRRAMDKVSNAGGCKNQLFLLRQGCRFYCNRLDSKPLST